MTSDVAKAVDSILASLSQPGTVSHEISPRKGSWRVSGDRVSDGFMLVVRVPYGSFEDDDESEGDPDPPAQRG